jgi:hypothetical protein
MIMRKVTTLVVLVLAFSMTFISSCNSDDDESLNPATASIEGKWNFNKIATEIDGVKYPEENYNEGNGCPKDFVELKSGGNYTEGYYYGLECTLDTSSGTWTRNGAIVTFTSDGESIFYEITSITTSILKIKYSETVDGVNYVYRVSFTKV